MPDDNGVDRVNKIVGQSITKLLIAPRTVMSKKGNDMYPGMPDQGADNGIPLTDIFNVQRRQLGQ